MTEESPPTGATQRGTRSPPPQADGRGERALRDAAKLYGARLVGAAFGIACSAWLFRIVPQKELAIWPACIALSNLVACFGSFGTGDTFIRLVPTHIAKGNIERARGILRLGLGVTVGLSAALAALLYLMAEPVATIILKNAESASLVRLLSLAVFFTVLGRRLDFAMSAVQQFGKIALLRLASDIARPVLSVVLYALVGVKGLIAAYTIVPLCACFFYARWLWPHVIGPAQRPSMGALLRVTLPFYGVSILQFFARRADYLLLGVFAGPEVLTMYFAAAKLSDILGEIRGAGITAVTPKLAERRGRAPEELRTGFLRCTRYAFLLLAPIYVAAAILGPRLVTLYAGSKYAAAGPILSVLCVCGLIDVAVGIHREHIRVFANPTHTLGLQGVAGVLNLVMIVSLVPFLGGMGLAVARTVASVALVFIGYMILRVTMPLRYDARALKTGLLANALMAGAILAVLAASDHALAVVAASVVGVLAYVVGLRHRLTGDDIGLLLRSLPGALVRGERSGRFIRWLARLLVRVADRDRVPGDAVRSHNADGTNPPW